MTKTIVYGKEITKYSRAVQYLESLFKLCNEYWFENQLETPVITVQSTPRAYGHYVLSDIWETDGTTKREINIGAGTLNRPIENILATMIHEMCHMFADTVLHVQDCSNNGVYHNKRFKELAETHGLEVSRSEKYGWSHTEPSDELLTWILENNLQEIKINRNEFSPINRIGGNSNTGEGATTNTPKKRTHVRKYQCKVCGCSVRATKEVHIACLDCGESMIEV